MYTVNLRMSNNTKSRINKRTSPTKSIKAYLDHFKTSQEQEGEMQDP